MSACALAAGTALGAGLVQWGPAITSLPHLRRALLPALSGMTSAHHVALTYDDGPDPVSTPHFLRLLERYDVRATFFLLGEQVAVNRSLVADLAWAGHELAVHGWDHACLAGKRPGVLTDELRRTRAAIEDVAQVRVVRYRPPYGVLTGAGLIAAHRAGLETVLWSAWGRDWSSRASAESIVHTVNSVLRPGGTVLLHDTDRTSSLGSWRRTLAATERLLAGWAADDLPVGTLANHAPPRSIENGSRSPVAGIVARSDSN